MSGDWTGGYVTEIDYTHGYYWELSPVLQRLALTLSRQVPPPEAGTYMELGYGQGLSAAIHAAATPCLVYGTDFNPSHAANANSLIQAAGIEAHLFEESFAEVAARTDLPKFDYIGFHGIWSWVSDENRGHITDILRHHLKPGGASYISYNTLPGWSAAYSVRHLLALHAECVGAKSQGIAARMDSGLAFATMLMDKGAGYFQANPAAASWLKQLAGQDRQYLVHEYLARDWHPQTFSQVAEWMDRAKLEFAASARLLDHVAALNLSADAVTVLNGISHLVLRESVRDYFVNQIFRRDLFVRGPRLLSQLEQWEILAAMRFVLVVRVEDFVYRLKAGQGDIALQEAIYRPLIEAFARDAYRPRRLAEIAGEVPALTRDQIIEALTVLVGAGHVFPAQSDAVVERALPRTQALNHEITRRARSSGDMRFLASPVTGSGFPVSRFHQLFLRARAIGRRTPEEWVGPVWETLAAQDQRIVKDGKTLADPADNRLELEAQAREFDAKTLPILIPLGIA